MTDAAQQSEQQLRLAKLQARRGASASAKATTRAASPDVSPEIPERTPGAARRSNTRRAHPARVARMALYQAGAQAPAYVNYAFGAAASADLARPVSTAVASTLPQRIRSVRVRFSTRTEQPDATGDARMSGNNYTLRYCTKLAGCTAGLREWSSVRTLTTELLVPNQSGMFY